MKEWVNPAALVKIVNFARWLICQNASKPEALNSYGDLINLWCERNDQNDQQLYCLKVFIYITCIEVINAVCFKHREC